MNNYKQFTTEEYNQNPTRKVVTRDGKDIRILCTDRVGDFPIVALAKDGQLVTYDKNGKFSTLYGDSPNDLFFVAEKHEGWIVFKMTHDGFYKTLSRRLYKIKEDAETDFAGEDVIFAKVEWEE